MLGFYFLFFAPTVASAIFAESDGKCLHKLATPSTSSQHLKEDCERDNIGKCMNTASCKGESRPLLCPGPAVIRCCLHSDSEMSKKLPKACTLKGSSKCPSNIDLKYHKRSVLHSGVYEFELTMGDRGVKFTLDPHLKMLTDFEGWPAEGFGPPRSIEFTGEAKIDLDISAKKMVSAGIQYSFARIMKALIDIEGRRSWGRHTTHETGQSVYTKVSFTTLAFPKDEMISYGLPNFTGRNGLLAPFLSLVNTGPYFESLDFYFKRMGICAFFEDENVLSQYTATVAVRGCGKEWLKDPGCIKSSNSYYVTGKPRWNGDARHDAWREIRRRPDLIGAFLLAERDILLMMTQVRSQATVLQNFALRDRGGFSVAGYVTSEKAMAAFLTLANTAADAAMSVFNMYRSMYPDCGSWNKDVLSEFARDCVATLGRIKPFPDALAILLPSVRSYSELSVEPGSFKFTTDLLEVRRPPHNTKWRQSVCEDMMQETKFANNVPKETNTNMINDLIHPLGDLSHVA